MRQSDLDILLHEGEGSMLEYKETLSSSFARELVAFANSTGGKILLGVRDDGTAGFVTTIFRPNPGVRAMVGVQSTGEVGTKSAPSRDPTQLPVRQDSSGAYGGRRTIRPHQVQAPSPEPAARKGAARNDHPRQTA